MYKPHLTNLSIHITKEYNQGWNESLNNYMSGILTLITLKYIKKFQVKEIRKKIDNFGQKKRKEKNDNI